VYGDSAANVTYTNTGQLTAGRLTDYSSTFSAIVAACYNVRTSWTDISNNPQSITDQGAAQALWSFSSGGPTRDGRVPPNGGVDITTPGGNLFAAYGLNTYWETFSFNLIQGGAGFYGRQSATSGASPILEGAVALLLQMNPKLTASQVRQFIHQSALTDSFTGTAPNQDWGLGKLNVLGAADLVAAGFNTNPVLSPTTLTFPLTSINQTSAAQTVTFSNTGPATDALGITSVATSGDFEITATTCGNTLAAGASCSVTITFKPSKAGTRTGALTIKDFNTHSPHTVTLTGTGTLLVSAVSRMTHGSITPPLDINLPLTGTRGVECRSSSSLGARNYAVVFTFVNNLTSVASASVSSGTGSVSSTVLGPNASLNLTAKQYEVNLTGVSNQQYVAVTLHTVQDSAGNSGDVVGPQMGILIGDVNATGGVDGNDVAAVQAHTRQAVNSNAQARFDVNADGGIDGNDVALTQGQTRSGLPSNP
jgi:hypothetical protein